MADFDKDFDKDAYRDSLKQEIHDRIRDRDRIHDDRQCAGPLHTFRHRARSRFNDEHVGLMLLQFRPAVLPAEVRLIATAEGLLRSGGVDVGDGQIDRVH